MEVAFQSCQRIFLRFSRLVALLFLSLHLLSNDNRAYYTRDVGPYSWQKEGAPKIFNDFGYLFGFTGNQIDPVKALKGMEYQIRR